MLQLLQCLETLPLLITMIIAIVQTRLLLWLVSCEDYNIWIRVSIARIWRNRFYYLEKPHLLNFSKIYLMTLTIKTTIKIIYYTNKIQIISHPLSSTIKILSMKKTTKKMNNRIKDCFFRTNKEITISKRE